MKTVLGIIIKDSKVLIGKVIEERVKEFGGIEYVFPGGKVEDSESSEKAIKREVLEETGLVVDVFKKIGERIHPKMKKKIEYFHCKIVSGKKTTKSSDNDDIEKLLWVDSGELSKYMPTLFDGVKNYLVTELKSVAK
jgi:8-oxo-dGTP diphosphatase